MPLYLETGLHADPSFMYTEVLSAKVENPLRLHGKISSFYVFGVYLSVLCSCSIIYNTKLCVHTYIVYTTLAVNTACHGARLTELMRLFTQNHRQAKSSLHFRSGGSYQVARTGIGSRDRICFKKYIVVRLKLRT
jgi:hypothetical protein